MLPNCFRLIQLNLLYYPLNILQILLSFQMYMYLISDHNCDFYIKKSTNSVPYENLELSHNHNKGHIVNYYNRQQQIDYI